MSQSIEQANVIFVFGDQWRAQATGYAGNPDVHTPYLDAFTQSDRRPGVCCDAARTGKVAAAQTQAAWRRVFIRHGLHS